MAALLCLLVCSVSGVAGMFGVSLYRRAASAQRHGDGSAATCDCPVQEQPRP